MPFINEDIKHRTQDIICRTGVNDKVKLIFNNGKRLGLLYKPPKERQQYPEHCETCDLTKTKGKCLIKSVVYKIKCKYCNSVYKGETARTIGSRIKEHVRSQTVYNHLKTHINNPIEDNCIEWEILHSGINKSIRRIVEAIEISKIGPAVMNGCIERFHLTSELPCWCTLNKRIFMISFVWDTNMAAMSIVFCVSWDCVKTLYWKNTRHLI